MAELGWTDAQWEKVNSAVTEAFDKSNVAERFITCYGPLADSAETVKAPTLKRESASSPGKLVVEDDATTKLFNLTVKVTLSSEQVADDSLSSALGAFRRAAGILAQVEDDVVFNGFDRAVQEASLAGSKTQKDRVELEKLTLDVVKSNPVNPVGLSTVPDLADPNGRSSGVAGPHPVDDKPEEIVKEIAKAIAELESAAHPGPFACVMGTKLFTQTHTPVKDSMVMPADRITPMLGGPLLRSGSMLATHGVVVSLASDVIDIVIATPPRAQFLHRNEDARYVFRVYEKFVLRIKDRERVPVYPFELKP
jgi:uncharacterized linocin/CFP29 family protein